MRKKTFRISTKFIFRKRLIFWLGKHSHGPLWFCKFMVQNLVWRDRDEKLSCSSALTKVTHQIPQLLSSFTFSYWKVSSLNLSRTPSVTPATCHHLKLIHPQVSHILPTASSPSMPLSLVSHYRVFQPQWCFWGYFYSHPALLSFFFSSLLNFDFRFLHFRKSFVTILNCLFSLFIIFISSDHFKISLLFSSLKLYHTILSPTKD